MKSLMMFWFCMFCWLIWRGGRAEGLMERDMPIKGWLRDSARHRGLAGQDRPEVISRYSSSLRLVPIEITCKIRATVCYFKGKIRKANQLGSWLLIMWNHIINIHIEKHLFWSVLHTKLSYVYRRCEICCISKLYRPYLWCFYGILHPFLSLKASLLEKYYKQVYI